MKPIILIVSLSLFPSAVLAQTTELSKQHSLLTTQCKSIRGHAGRIVAESSESSLNREVAAAHLGEIAKFRDQMEQQLASSKKLLNAEMLKSVSAEYESLEKTCATIEELAGKIRRELEKKEPARSVVRELAVRLRSEMTGGYEVHEKMKKKLGLS